MLQVAIRFAIFIAAQACASPILTHPMADDATRSYHRLGFDATPSQPDQLLLLLSVDWYAIRSCIISEKKDPALKQGLFAWGRGQSNI
jgi:hypothetical protein